MQTLLPRQINDALTAAAYFLEQLIVAEFSREVCDALRRCGVVAFWFSWPLLAFTCKRSKPTLEKATWAASFWRVGWDFRAAFLADSECADHCLRVARALPLFTA